MTDGNNKADIERLRRYRKQQKSRNEFFRILPKEVPIPPRVLQSTNGHKYDTFDCQRCGSELTECHWRYCPNCGQAVAHASNCGIHGWKTKDAHERMQQIIIEVNNKYRDKGGDQE